MFVVITVCVLVMGYLLSSVFKEGDELVATLTDLESQIQELEAETQDLKFDLCAERLKLKSADEVLAAFKDAHYHELKEAREMYDDEIEKYEIKLKKTEEYLITVKESYLSLRETFETSTRTLRDVCDEMEYDLDECILDED